MKRPNIILTIADDHRGTAQGCVGIEPVLTPALDRLAARGIRFSNTQHLGACHGAVCAPSRAMLHTGRPYFELDDCILGLVRQTGSPEDRIPPLLGQRLQDAGYDCYATGKWHNGPESFRRSFTDGGKIFFGGMNDHWFTPVNDFDPAGIFAPEDQRIAEGFSTEIFAQAAIDYVRSRGKDSEPFFCYCAFTAPHDPRTPPDAWRRQYLPSQMPLPPNCVPRFFADNSPSPPGVKPAFDNGSLDQRDELLLGVPRPGRDIQRGLAEYYGMISHMDEWIGRLHEAVAEIGALENTLIIHTSDHGLALGQHGLLGKQNLYQHSLGVPLLMAGPGVPQGVVSEALCYQQDLHPTLLEAAGMNAGPGPFQSLAPLLRSESSGRDHLGGAFQQTQRSIRDARYKLIEYHLPAGPRTELFDLVSDPWETRNLAGDHPQIVDELRAALRSWQDGVGDNAWASDR